MRLFRTIISTIQKVSLVKLVLKSKHNQDNSLQIPPLFSNFFGFSREGRFGDLYRGNFVFFLRWVFQNPISKGEDLEGGGDLERIILILIMIGFYGLFSDSDLSIRIVFFLENVGLHFGK